MSFWSNFARPNEQPANLQTTADLTMNQHLISPEIMRRWINSRLSLESVVHFIDEHTSAVLCVFVMMDRLSDVKYREYFCPSSRVTNQ